MRTFSLNKNWSLIAGPIVASALWLLMYHVGDLDAQPCWVAAITCVCAVWWIFEPIPIAATSLVPFAAFPLTGVMTDKQVAQSYGHHMVLLLLGGFMISKALEKSYTHRRLALLMVRAVGGRGGRRILLGFMLASATLSMWISNTATTLMLMPVAIAVLDQVETKDRAKLGVPLMLAIAYAASIGGMGTPIGTPPNVIFMDVYTQTTGKEITFAGWMKIALPIVLVMLPCTWLWLSRGLGTARQLKLPDQGKWTKPQVRVMIVFAFTVLAWIFRKGPAGGWSTWVTDLMRTDNDTSILDVSKAGDSTVALIAVLAMFLIPSGEKTATNKTDRLLDWKTAVTIPWGLLLLVGGGIAIASGFQESGLATIIGESLEQVSALPLFILIFTLCIAVTFLTEVTSNTATATLLMPILAATAIAAKMDPTLLMAPAVISCSCAFMLPVATMPNAIVFGTGHVPIKQMAREGFILNLLGALVIAIIAVTLLG